MKFLTFGIVLLSSALLVGCLGNNDVTDPNAQLKSDTTAISTYVQLFASKAIKIPSGVWYEVDTVGTGFYPSFADTVSFTYNGKLLSTGGSFDKSTTPVAFTLPNLIAGWQIGIPKFREGTYGRLFIPSGLAYGSVSVGSVPANSNLVFEIKVTKVSGYKTKSDTAVISKYLTDNNITNVIKDDSGIRYVITSSGSGAAPLVSDFVTVTYTGKLLEAPQTTFSSVTTPTEYYLAGLVNSWGIILPKVPVGSTIKMFVPSTLAYDVFTNVQGVPANSIVTYDITVISARHSK